jgi:Domain of unknown function (DUF1906)
MTIPGIDCALDCTKRISAIQALNVHFVGRYYRQQGSQYTPLTKPEAQALSKAGFQIVALWESASNHIGHFSHASGVDEGTSAYHQAMLTGQPARTPIYFAVDFDAANSEIAGSINDYFRGVTDGFAAIGSGQPAYDIGVYGSGNTCSWLLSHGRVTSTWMAQSTGWGGFKTFKSWNILQGPSRKKPFDYDTDQANENFGGFTV